MGLLALLAAGRSDAWPLPLDTLDDLSRALSAPLSPTEPVALCLASHAATVAQLEGALATPERRVSHNAAACWGLAPSASWVLRVEAGAGVSVTQHTADGETRERSLGALSPHLERALGLSRPPRWPEAPAPRLRTVMMPFRELVALGVARLDPEGPETLVLLAPTRVHLARFEAGSLRFLTPPQGVDLSAVGGSPEPLREPLGVALFDSTSNSIVLRTSAMAATVQLRVVAGRFEVRALGAAWPLTADPTGPGYSLRVDRVVGLDGALAGLPERARGALPLATAEGLVGCDGEGQCGVYRGADEVLTLRQIVPPVWVGDVDEDGVVEVLGASPVGPEAGEALRVMRVRGASVTAHPALPIAGPMLGLTVGRVLTAENSVVVAWRDRARRTVTLSVLP